MYLSLHEFGNFVIVARRPINVKTMNCLWTLPPTPTPTRSAHPPPATLPTTFHLSHSSPPPPLLHPGNPVTHWKFRFLNRCHFDRGPTMHATRSSLPAAWIGSQLFASGRGRSSGIARTSVFTLVICSSLQLTSMWCVHHTIATPGVDLLGISFSAQSASAHAFNSLGKLCSGNRNTSLEFFFADLLTVSSCSSRPSSVASTAALRKGAGPAAQQLELCPTSPRRQHACSGHLDISLSAHQHAIPLLLRCVSPGWMDRITRTTSG